MRINKLLIAAALSNVLAAHAPSTQQNSEVLQTKLAPTKNQKKAARRKGKR